jgi:HTH-type transcriptional regulator/antitoxin HigA
MDIKPIKTESDCNAALVEIERLMEAHLNTPDGDKLDVLSTLVEAYEEKHYPVGPPDPIEAILHQMESQGLTRGDLFHPVTYSKVRDPLKLSYIVGHQGAAC